MNKSKLKSYAPAARREFIQAVTDRAYFYGLSENKNEIQPVEEKGDVAIIGGRAFPRKIAAQRKNLEQRIQREGFAQVMEAIAYTWFNRFLALRYMEIHGYLEHGFRVLSNPSGSAIPEILEQAAHVQLPGLYQKKVIELKLDGSKDVELYRMILVAQCNALNTAMPFLFERIDDETELLLPDNLLHSDSLIRKLVTEIDEEDWQQVEIIGWLYQFYISEKKDQVIGKVVKPEDIPAATQLFTPNWIVKYMVQNSLGRMWLATYPNSSLKGKMEYYIEPAEQTDEVKAQLAAITPKELNPESITLIDPASGSGHILVEAYDLFKEIYLERGYRSRDIPRLILEKNLYGLDRPGLIYAHSGNKDFWEIYNGQIPLNPPLLKGENIPHFEKGGQGGIFKPDDDGIIPVIDMDWFEDDTASRFEKFLKVAWPAPSPQPSPTRGEGVLLEENLKFVADSLSTCRGALQCALTPRETIRRYFSTHFFKDHLQTYKKRPIYWLFSSGKQRAFECLVYLHRYNEATLSRMRNEYVTPLQGKFSARADYLNNEINAATSTSARTKLQKQLDALKKKQVELAAFDDLLRHYADKRIPLDLDDGVKFNYGKFGNLLAEVKAVTGTESE
jgi:hypothetical protein